MTIPSVSNFFKPFNDASSRPIFWWISLLFAFAAFPLHGATILVLGDSLSAGYGIRVEDAWPSLLERKLLSDKNFSPNKPAVINASISGETTAGGRTRLPALIERHRPSIVILELGANDGLRGLSLPAMKANLNAMLQMTKKSGAKPLLIGMRLPPNYGPYADEFSATYAALASHTKVAFVPFLLDHLADKPEGFQADGLHPTRDAQAQVLDNVWPTLQTLLR